MKVKNKINKLCEKPLFETMSTDTVDLENLVDEEITVNLKGGQKLEGQLQKIDDYMNLVLKNVVEKDRDGETREHDIVVVKGGNARTITKSD